MDVPREPSVARAHGRVRGLSVDAFDQIFTDNYDRIWRYLFRLAGRECADAVAGDVFVQALATRHRFDPTRGSITSWLYGIASNLGRQWLRRRSRGRRAIVRLSQRRRADADLAAANTGADDRLDGESDASRVLTAFEHLRDSDREILALVVWEDLSYAEVAAVLDVPIGTVRSRLSRTRTRLRELAAADDQVPGDTRAPSEDLP